MKGLGCRVQGLGLRDEGDGGLGLELRLFRVSAMVGIRVRLCVALVSDAVF